MRAIFPSRASFAVLSAFVCLVAAGQSRAADPLDQWHWRNPLPQGNALANVVWVNNRYVALGELGTLLTSTDGTNWTAQQTTTLDQLRDCAYGNGTYVTVGDFGTLLTSSNAVDWTPQFGGTFYSLNGVTFGNNRFVAVGAGGNILTSEDGNDWTLRAIGPWIYYDVIYAGNLFVAGGQSNIVTSTDGITWTRRSSVSGQTIRSIAHGDGKFMAAAGTPGGWGYLDRIWSSDDGLTWQPQMLPFYYYSLWTIKYGAGVWIVAGASTDNYWGEGRIYVSVDGNSWGPVLTNSSGFTGVACSGSQFLASSMNGSFFGSSNGTNWSNTSGTAQTLLSYIADLIYTNGRFLGVGGTQITVSTEGRSWTNPSSITNFGDGDYLESVVYGNGRYVAGSYYRAIFTSTDGLTWTRPALELPNSPNWGAVSGLAYGNGVFVGVVNNSYGEILTSADGLAWTSQLLNTNRTNYLYLSDVVFAKGLFVAVSGWYGTIATSSDGTNWTLHKTGVAGPASAVTYGNSRFVAVGYNAIVTSPDGTNWVQSPLSELGDLLDVAFGGGWFVAVGRNQPSLFGGESPIWVSRDGLSWFRRPSRTPIELRSVAYGNGTFVISGFNGAILQSDPFLNLSFDLISGPRLTVTGPNDRWCTIESTESLGSASIWQPQTNVLVNGGTAVIEAPSFTHTTNRFYRAKLLP